MVSRGDDARQEGGAMGGRARTRTVEIILAAAALLAPLIVDVEPVRAAEVCGTSATFTICLTVPDGILSGDVVVTSTVAGDVANLAELRYAWGATADTTTPLFSDFEAPWSFVWPTDRYLDATRSLNVRARRRNSQTFGAPVTLTTTIDNGNDGSVSTSPADWDQVFVARSTPGDPLTGDPVVAAVGDGADGMLRSQTVVDSIAASPASVFLYLGDVYEAGTPTEFENNYGRASFDPAGGAGWGAIASWTRPTLGNHEAKMLPAWLDYWHQRPLYESFVHGGVLFLNLDSECGLVPGGCGVGGPQYTFVQQALASATQSCIVAMWHRPVLSLNDDNVPMRPIWKLLAQGGGDIVLNGHIHAMQQYLPLNGALEAGMPDSHMVELISGAGGHKAATGTDGDARAAWQSNTVPGAVYLTAVGGATGDASALDWAFKDASGAVVTGNRGPGTGRVACGGDDVPPTDPGTPTGSSVAPGTIDLTWTASTDDVATTIAYRLYRDGGTSPIATVSSGSTTTVSYRDSGLEAGTSHGYRVEAFDGINASATTPPSEPIVVMGGSPEIFRDTFSGGLSAWTTVNVTNDGTRGGTAPPSARVQAANARGFAWRPLGAGYGSVCVDAGFNLASIASTPVTLLKLRTATDVAIGGLQATGGRALQIRADVAGSTISTGVALPSGWHTVSVCGATGASGSWTLALDGVPRGSWIVNNGTAPIARLQFGDKGGKTVTFNIDDVLVRQA
jgi:Calcineurin-like phosphoesterase